MGFVYDHGEGIIYHNNPSFEYDMRVVIQCVWISTLALCMNHIIPQTNISDLASLDCYPLENNLLYS